jgi:aspartate carbamoyltransferase catalytic subunit
MSKQAQQVFLRDAMLRHNLTRQQFADRIGASKRALDNWLLPTDSKGFRPMPETVWVLIREILK